MSQENATPPKRDMLDGALVRFPVLVEWIVTTNPEGNASAMTHEGFGCGPSGEGFVVMTERPWR